MQNKGAEYGKPIVPTLSGQLENKYSSGFIEKNKRILRFAEQFPDKEIVVTLSRQLSWLHFVELLPINNREAGLFQVHQVSSQLMSIRALRNKTST